MTILSAGMLPGCASPKKAHKLTEEVAIRYRLKPKDLQIQLNPSDPSKGILDLARRIEAGEFGGALWSGLPGKNAAEQFRREESELINTVPHESDAWKREMVVSCRELCRAVVRRWTIEKRQIPKSNARFRKDQVLTLNCFFESACELANSSQSCLTLAGHRTVSKALQKISEDGDRFQDIDHEVTEAELDEHMKQMGAMVEDPEFMELQ